MQHLSGKQDWKYGQQMLDRTLVWCVEVERLTAKQPTSQQWATQHPGCYTPLARWEALEYRNEMYQTGIASPIPALGTVIARPDVY